MKPSEVDPVTEVHFIIHGLVQGVGFRYMAKAYAEQLGIVGTVRNLPDGSVEIYAQGSGQQLGHFLEKLTGPKGPGKVESVEKTISTTLSGRFQKFEIVY